MVDATIDFTARFNELIVQRLKPEIGKDVTVAGFRNTGGSMTPETPSLDRSHSNHAVNEVANCRETRLGKTYIHMTVQDQIKNYIASQPEPKRNDMQLLHDLILRVNPGCKLWFLDGTNSEGKIVSNPNIGYGSRDHRYADGSVSEFYRIGLSANKTGISVYILGIKDKKYLADTYAKTLGKATVTGYCIRFKSLTDINTNTLEAAIRFGFENPNDA